MRSRRPDRWAALGIVVFLLITSAISLPYADRPGPHMPAFVATYDSGLAVIDLVTGMLLIGQFRQLRSLALLILAGSYLFTSLITFAHMLSYPEVFTQTGLLGATDQTAAWLYVSWHVAFPVCLLIYAMTTESRFDLSIREESVFSAILLCVGIAVAGAVLCTMFAVFEFGSLPTIVRNGNYGGKKLGGVNPYAWVVSLAALATLLLRTRARRLLDLWICVVLIGWVLEVLIGSLASSQRYHVGWYIARFYGLTSASIVLSALLIETGVLYAKLTRLLGEMHAQSVELSKSEAALRQAQKMEAIGQITGGIAHDFNNLLTVIIGSLDILSRRATDDRLSQLVGYAMEAASKGSELTKQLLAFSRRKMQNPETVNPNRLIRDFGGLMRRALGEPIRIELDLEEPTGSVRVDRAQFEAAILNLGVNARDAMNGAGTIRIETRSVELDATFCASNPSASPGEHIAIALSDTGAGMDAETVARAFEPFFTTKAVGKGSGLGLSQVYGFVKSADGMVRIDSELGAGTTVTLYLPRVDDENPTAGASDVVGPTSEAACGKLVLIVEDDPAVREMAVEMIRDLGYRTDAAEDASVALLKLRSEQRIDILFSDIVMPGGMNGVELADEAKRLRPGIKVVLTSGYAAIARGAQQLPEGLRIVSKPYRHEELARELGTAVDAA